MNKSVKSTMTEVLRRTISESGLSLYRIAHDTGLTTQSLLRFKHGETTLRLDKADVLAEYFELELTSRGNR